MPRDDDKGNPLRIALRKPERPRPPSRRGNQAAAALAVVLIAACSLVLVVLGPESLLVRAAVFTIAVGASYLVARALRTPLPASEDAQAPHVVVDRDGLSVAPPRGDPVPLMSLRPAFGLSILASATRDKIVLALTSPNRVVCIGTDIPSTGPDRRRLLDLIPLAATVAGDDLVMSTVLPDGTVLVVRDALWLQLLDALMALDPSALERCYLSDTNGRPIEWQGDRLRTSHGTFRLDQPFEWRAWAFHEANRTFGAPFQATSIRQGNDEVVFVSLVGADVRQSIHEAADGRWSHADTFLLRDATLSDMQQDSAPLSAQRIGIDRLFMLPLRRVLDRAHRVNRPSVPGDASAP